MTQPKTVLYNQLEQVLSADLNRTGMLAGFEISEMLRNLTGGIADTPVAVVRRGLLATVGAGLSVDISAGEAMRFGAAPDANRSAYRLARLPSTQNAPLSAADPANPRIDLISFTDTDANADSTLRNVLTLPTRTVTPTAINKTRNPSITLTVTAGTPAASPTFPATPANNVALWYVYVPAAAAAVTDNFLMDARIQINTWSEFQRFSIEYGLSVGSTNLTDVLITTGQGQVGGARIQNLTEKTFTQADILSPGHAALATNTLYHVYCVPKGGGNPIGKNVLDGLVFYLNTGAPTVSGGPTAGGLQYNPLQGTGITVSRTNLNGIYLGTLMTDAVPQFQLGNSGTLLSRDGQRVQRVYDPITGTIPGGGTGFLRKPTVSWAGANTIQLGSGSVMMGGELGLFPSTAVTFANIHSGQVEAANTWYYLYVRRRSASGGVARAPVRSYVAVISPFAPTAIGNISTPEAGFASFDYLYVGSARNDAGSNLHAFYRSGDEVMFRSPGSGGDFLIHNADIAVAAAVTTIPMFIPSSTRWGLVFLEVDQTDATDSLLVGYNEDSTGAATHNAFVMNVPGDGIGHLETFMLGDEVNTFEINKSALSGVLSVSITQRGYRETIAALDLPA